jgi:peptide/nickel transport system ATP-binding protein
LKAAGIGLRVQDLRVVFDGFAAVDGVSFEVAPGESFGIVGESGSGKSTVLRALCGLAPRSAGQVALTGSGDLPAPGSKAFRRQVQMVFQDPYGSLHPRQTVDRILAEPLAIHGIADTEARIAQACWTKWAWARAFAFATRTSSPAGSASALPWPAR